MNKNRIWFLFVLGASSLFGITVLAENNEKWFPAISRANKALAASAAAAKERARLAEEEQLQFEERLAEVKQETTLDSRLESAVAEGLLKAKRPPPAIAAAAASVLDAEIEEESVSPASMVAAAAIEEAQISEEAKFPAELGVEVVENDTSESEEQVMEQDEEQRSSVASGRAAPLFEISGEQIEASAKNYQQREVLNELSIEDLQRELEERKKASASNNGSGGGGGGN